MLITLMYHRVSFTKFAHEPDAFANHLNALTKQYSIVIPGDELPKNKISICLTFDDAYYDFYHYVFPLLQQLDIKAVLAIPTKLILNKTTATADERLAVSYDDAIKTNQSQAALCTWQEIIEMVNTGLVIPASHSSNHQNLTATGVNLEEEIIDSKQLLEEKTKQTITTFVYPYGQMNRPTHQLVKKYYPFAMRIGSAFNINWENLHGLIYRIDAENIWPTGEQVISPKKLFSYGMRFLSNTLRFR